MRILALTMMLSILSCSTASMTQSKHSSSSISTTTSSTLALLLSFASLAAVAASPVQPSSNRRTHLDHSHHHHHHDRMMKEFDFFENYCQVEGALFFDCFTTLENPDACSNCHLDQIGRTNSFGTTSTIGCQSFCKDNSGGGPSCNTLGQEAVDCSNQVIFQYHCQGDFNRFKKCDNDENNDDCAKEEEAFVNCLQDGIKVLRGRDDDITTCNDQVETFETCVDTASFSFQQRESCKACYSDYAFGIRNDTTTCSAGGCSTTCSTSGSNLASCIRSTFINEGCRKATANLIQCSESKNPSACILDAISRESVACFDFNGPNTKPPTFNVTNFTEIDFDDFDFDDFDFESLNPSAAGGGRVTASKNKSGIVLMGGIMILSFVMFGI